MEDFYEHIDDYKNGLLTGEALEQFEAAIAEDSSLRLAVDNYHTAKSISEGLLEMDMLETLNNLKDRKESQHNTKENSHLTIVSDRSLPNTDRTAKSSSNTKSIFFNFRNFIGAASIIGTIVCMGWWMMMPNAELKRKENILAQLDQYKPIDPDATKSIDTLGMTHFQKGKHFYALNRFEESIVWFELMIEQEKDKDLLSEGYYWLGHSYIQEWRVEDAKKAWEESDEMGVKNALKMISKYQEE